MTKTQKLTESALARTLGVSRQAVNELVKRGILPKDKDGLIDFELAKLALMNKVRPSGKSTTTLQESETPPASTAPAAAAAPSELDDSLEITSYHVAKTLNEAAMAQINRLKLAEMRGELIRVTAVKATLATIFATTRDALLQIPARLAPTLAADVDPASVQNALHTEIHQALHHLAGAPAAIGQDSPAP